MKTFLFLLLPIIFLPYVHAQPARANHPLLNFDERTQVYTMKFPANAERQKALPSVSWPSKTRIDPSIALNIKYLDNKRLSYTFIVKNGPNAQQRILGFGFHDISSIDGIDEIMEIMGHVRLSFEDYVRSHAAALKGLSEQDVRVRYADYVETTKRERERPVLKRTLKVVPDGWIVRPSSRNWRYRLMITNDPAYQPLAPELWGLLPNKTVQLNFVSRDLPGLNLVAFEGVIRTPILPSEDFGDRTEEETKAWHTFLRDDRIDVPILLPMHPRDAQGRIDAWSILREEFKRAEGFKLIDATTFRQITSLLREAESTWTTASSTVQKRAVLADLQPRLAALLDSAPVVLRQLLDFYLAELQRQD